MWETEKNKENLKGRHLVSKYYYRRFFFYVLPKEAQNSKSYLFKKDIFKGPGFASRAMM